MGDFQVGGDLRGHGTISFGTACAATDTHCTAFGFQDTASGGYATVGGGSYNRAYGEGSVVAGGHANAAETLYSVVSGGIYNTAGAWATVCGGASNWATADFSTVLNGYGNRVDGGYGVVGGYFCNVAPAGLHTFAWGENCSTSTPRAVVFYHSNAPTKLGVGVQNPSYNIDVAGGAYCNGTNWVNGSSRESKQDISALSEEELRAVLEELKRTEVVRFRYRTEDGERHIGLIAEDAPASVATPERDGINTADAIGWLTAAVKAQQLHIERLEARLAELEPGR
jgi:hypothetical protein